MRIVFWGTPDFATPSLLALAGEGHDVVAVVTQPDRPVGRSRSTVVPSAVKSAALLEGIPVLQPPNARDPDVIQDLRSFSPELFVVVAFGQLLSEEVINLPPLGTVNVHASLLPRFRGAAPIQASIRAGDAETGVSVMQMVKRLDAGPVLLQSRTPILPDETAGELQQRLSELGASTLIEALALMAMKSINVLPQDDAQATYAPRITREDARVNWATSSDVVARTIRAYDPKPGAFSTLGALEVRFFGVRQLNSRGGRAGEVLDIDESGMLVACGGTDAAAGDGQGGGSVRIAYVHPAGKRRLAALDWAQGRGVAIGDVFGTSGPENS